MDKLVGVVVIVALVMFLYISVFHNGLSQSIEEKGTKITEQITNSNSYHGTKPETGTGN